jgi:two-component system NarL family sensor kinase
MIANGQRLYVPEFGTHGVSEVVDLLKEANTIRRADLDRALRLSQSALTISREMHYAPGIGNSLLSIGLCQSDQNEYRKSMMTLQSALPYCLQTANQDRTLLPRLYNGLGKVFKSLGKSDSAFNYYYKALKEIKYGSREDTTLLPVVYGNIGAAFAEQKQTRQALFYLRKSLSLATLYHDTLVQLQNYANIGVVYENLKNGDSSLYYFKHSLELARQFLPKKQLRRIYYFIGVMHGRERNLALAKSYFDSSARADPEKARHDTPLQTGFGDIYNAQGKHLQAIPYYQNAIAIALESGLISENAYTYANLAESYHYSGNDAMAFKYQKVYADLKDSLINIAKIQNINQLEIQYRTASQEKDLVRKQLLITLQQKKLLQKNLWMGGICAGALLLISMMVMLYRNYHTKQKLQLAEMVNLKLQQLANRRDSLKQGEESERIRIARDLHDGIGSILAAARMHLDIFKEDQLLPEYADTYRNGMKLLDEAYQGLRYTAHNLLPPEQLLEQGLVAATSLYCTKISKQDTFNVHFQHYGSVPDIAPEMAISFYRIIQELVHNAAKHAEAKEVIVEIGTEQNQLSIIVEDNGKGWKVTEDNIDIGIGMRNLKERIIILGGTFEVDSRQGIGTTVYISCIMEGKIKNHEPE